MTVHIDGSMGDIALLGADCAEEFTLKNSSYCEPGTVMILNDDETVSPSNTEFDKKVVGVISGAGRYKPAIIMDKQENNKNRVPIAVMGKVLCKVDSSYAKIERGDLLTTSPTLGHAMKAEDPIKTFGSVIGKALATAQEDLSMIPILVSLR
jgi:hypothetical protein